MELVNTNNVDENIRKQAWSLLENSFPLCEQRPYDQHLLALKDSAFHADIITDEGEFVGIIFYWLYDDKYCFVEYLATEPQRRGGGKGRKAVEMLFDRGYVMVLEIDPPVDEISIRRRGFYERMGFAMNPYEHIHPSYRPTTEPHLLYVMSFPYLLSQEEFDRFREYSLSHVLSYVHR